MNKEEFEKFKQMKIKDVVIKYGKMMAEGKITKMQYKKIIELWKASHEDIEQEIKRLFG